MPRRRQPRSEQEWPGFPLQPRSPPPVFPLAPWFPPTPRSLRDQTFSWPHEISARWICGAPTSRWTLWWAVLEYGHVSDVKAGENHGVTLRHDHVVRLDGRIAPFAGALVRRIDAPSRGEGGRVPRVIAVLTDAVSGATVQAVELRCAG